LGLAAQAVLRTEDRRETKVGGGSKALKGMAPMTIQ